MRCASSRESIVSAFFAALVWSSNPSDIRTDSKTHESLPGRIAMRRVSHCRSWCSSSGLRVPIADIPRNYWKLPPATSRPVCRFTSPPRIFTTSTWDWAQAVITCKGVQLKGIYITFISISDCIYKP